jgi:hypothetical protein
MVSFKKILHQITPFSGHGHSGLDKGVLFRITKELDVAADRFLGKGATFTEGLPIEISGIIHPFVKKRWNDGVTENFADLILVTNEILTWDSDDDTANDEIEYKSVRYRIVDARHVDVLPYDDRYDYALRRKLAQAGGL